MRYRLALVFPKNGLKGSRMTDKDQVVMLTYEGIKELKDELNERKTHMATEIAERLRVARAHGDLSENSEYEDAKEAQAQNKLRIAKIESILAKAQVIDETEISKSKVTLGCLVTIKDEETGEEEEYHMVGPREQDIFRNKISSESPVGQAIMEKRKGDQIIVKTPAGAIKYKIVKIARP